VKFLGEAFKADADALICAPLLQERWRANPSQFRLDNQFCSPYFSLMTEQSYINHALKTYLGTGTTGGFQPIGCEERLRMEFPKNHAQVMELMSRYLDEDQKPDWSKGDLIQETNRFIEALSQKFPELDAITIRALANRWSFGYR
jgi:hypothetical protein